LSVSKQTKIAFMNAPCSKGVARQRECDFGNYFALFCLVPTSSPESSSWQTTPGTAGQHTLMGVSSRHYVRDRSANFSVTGGV
jgi:hypothetical protein